jgi:hypothetical protein
MFSPKTVLPAPYICRKSVSETRVDRVGAACLVLAVLSLPVGPLACKKPVAQAPLAPSHHGPVRDLTAVRAGNEISLSWGMPTKTTRQLAVHDSITVRVCRRETPSDLCAQAGKPLLLAPGATGTFSELLPDGLVSGSPRLLYYFVELVDRKGHSTGLSNTVATLAGAPLPAVQGLSAELAANGVLLRWEPVPAAEEPAGTILRLHRTLLRLSLADAGPSANPLADNRVIEVAPGSDHTLDTRIRSGDIYEYSAQRVVQAHVGDQTLELAGQLSVPVQVNVPR